MFLILFSFLSGGSLVFCVDLCAFIEVHEFTQFFFGFICFLVDCMYFSKFFAIVLLFLLLWNAFDFRIYGHQCLIIFDLFVGHEFNPILALLQRLFPLSVISDLLLQLALMQLLGYGSFLKFGCSFGLMLLFVECLGGCVHLLFSMDKFFVLRSYLVEIFELSLVGR